VRQPGLLAADKIVCPVCGQSSLMGGGKKLGENIAASEMLAKARTKLTEMEKTLTAKGESLLHH